MTASDISFFTVSGLPAAILIPILAWASSAITLAATPEGFRSQHFSFWMVLESEDLSQKAERFSGPQNTMKREMMVRKRLFTT